VQELERVSGQCQGKVIQPVRDELRFALKIAQELPAQEIPRLLGEIEEIRCTAMARLSAQLYLPTEESDELLGVEEASRKLGVSKDFLYRRGRHFPFVRRMGRKLLFSKLGIERHIAKVDPLNVKRRGSTLA
jgi:hypothetical protein